MNVRIEYHLVAYGTGRIVSKHQTMDSAISAKFKQLNPRAYEIKQRMVTK